MSKEEKKRKFHDALMNLYLPPQPLPHQQHPVQQMLPKPSDFGCDGLYMDPISEDNDLEKETSSDDASDCAPQKLTRAQRKRIRKKKLKEAAPARRKIIGPLLPTHENIQNETVQQSFQAQGVSINSQDSSCGSDVPQHAAREQFKE